MIDLDETDPEEYAAEHKQELIYIIRNSDDAFARACAWTLLDRVTPANEAEQLREEFEKAITGAGGELA